MELLTKEKVSQRHPCLDGCGAQGGAKYGRLHLPVSSRCNIQCRFCRRAFNREEDRPGVTHGILKPGLAVEKVAKALELCPEITVVGIAGPGDTLATMEAIETFSVVHARYPELIMCMSTNGLMLSEYAGKLDEAGVRSVTVTVNAVDPETLFRIVSHVTYQGVTYRDAAGSKLLIEKQLEGIQRASEFAVVKVNTVLIPGVNDHHIAEIAETVSAAGANIYNIIPLIPQHEFSETPAPTCDDLNAARKAAEQYVPVFRHCQHCRADAVGVPGFSDFSSRLYEGTVETFSHG
ncbi:putative nitrogenase cofactor biosynthesis protein NifB [Spirochaetia bacterium]|nr:putative nitrogenase cofactor biosynthesis protein NifB [Spirochaetia bacterium]